jgi:phage regulator Rha-like protein
MAENKIVNADKLQDLIYTIRGVQVMYDNDLAELYGVEIKRLNEQVKRNRERFPEEFMFQLTDEEFAFLRSQNATLETGRGRHRKYLPYVFTEQGVAMLSAVLRSETAVKISIQIIKAFVAMRKFITTNAQIFHRLDAVEQKQLEQKVETDEKFDRIFNAIESKEITPKQGIFFDGQIFDAYKFVSDLIRRAKKSIIIIDNYIDDSVLLLLTKRKKSVTVKIFTKTISKQLALDVKKYNSQYPPVEIIKFKYAHDRFIIIDDKEVFHFGASLKDLGKKWFAFSKLEKDAFRLMERLEGK